MPCAASWAVTSSPPSPSPASSSTSAPAPASGSARPPAAGPPPASSPSTRTSPCCATASPPRCQPVQADLLHGLPFPDASFDYVHQRLLAAAIPATAWPQVLAELVRVTQPGGWLELLEVTGEMEREGPLQRQVRGWVAVLLEQRGLALEATLQLPAWLADLGLSPRVHRFLMPLWGRRQGAPLFRRDVLSALQTLAPLLAAANHVPLSLVQERLTALPAEWEPAAPTRGGAP